MTVGVQELDAALDYLGEALTPALDKDWDVPAGDLDWTCRGTAEHIGDVLLSYAYQLVAQPSQRYVRFLATVAADATPAEVLEFTAASGRILASTLRTAPPDLRADHPTGRADLAGWAGMGCVEVLVHGDDIARGLGLPYDPPAELCAAVLARMFPVEAPGLSGIDPWTALQWCTGRIALPDRLERPSWQWQGAPPDDPAQAQR